MSIIVPLDPVPNQEISIQLDMRRYVMRMRDIGGIMAMDLEIDEVVILTGHRVVGGLPLIPYEYLERGGGNFIFSTEFGDIPYWDKFGITQDLFYFTALELEEARAN